MQNPKSNEEFQQDSNFVFKQGKKKKVPDFEKVPFIDLLGYWWWIKLCHFSFFSLPPTPKKRQGGGLLKYSYLYQAIVSFPSKTTQLF